MKTLTASEARKRLSGLLDQVAESHRPVRILGKRGSAILVSEEDWTAIEDTLSLVAIPGMPKSIEKGLQTPVEQCVKAPGW